MKMFIIDNEDKTVATLNNDSSMQGYHFFNANITDELNKGSEIDLDIEAVNIDPAVLSTIKEEQRILFIHETGSRLYYIKDIEDNHTEVFSKHVYGTDASIELIDFINVEDVTGSLTITAALEKFLAGTGWSLGDITDLSSYALDTRYKNKNILQCIQLLAAQTGKEIKYTYEIAGNKVFAKKVHLVDKIGNNYGKRFIYGKDLTSIKKTVKTDSLKTAIYPLGKEDKDKGTIVTLTDVSYSMDKDGIDKAVGVSYLEDSNATNLWGYLINGSRVPRMTLMQFSDAEDTNTLFAMAMAELKKLSVPVISYAANVIDLYKVLGLKELSYAEVMLGDTVGIFDKEFKPALTLQSRVVKISYNLDDNSQTVITLGTIIPSIVDAKDPKTQMEQVAKDVVSNSNAKVDLSPIQEEIDKVSENVGKYPAIAEINQQLFNGAIGYHSLTKDNGLWVYDRPVDQQPTKAVIIKGGQIGVAAYNTQLQKWELGTFIDGMSVNASMINTGKLNVDLIDAGAITADKLDIETQTKISNSVDNATVSNAINVAIETANNSIQSKIDAINKTTETLQNDLNGTTTDISNISTEMTTIKQTQEGISSTVQQTNQRVENISLSAYNLLDNANISFSGSEATIKTVEAGVISGVEYTLTVDALVDDQALADGKMLVVRIYDKSGTGYNDVIYINSDTEAIYSKTFTATATTTYCIDYDFSPAATSSSGTATVNWTVLLKGTIKAAAWMPSKNDVDGELSSTYATKSEIDQSSTELELKFSQAGGDNLIRNSKPTSTNSKYWIADAGSPAVATITGWGDVIQQVPFDGVTYKAGIWFSFQPNNTSTWCGLFNNSLNTDHYGVTFNTNIPYTITLPLYAEQDGTIQLQISDQDGSHTVYYSDYISVTKGTQIITRTFTPTVAGNSPVIWIFNNTSDNQTYNYFMPWILLQKGSISKSSWCPAADEVYTGIASADADGITVTHTQANAYTQLNATGLEVFDTDTGNSVAHFGRNQTAYIRQLDAQQINSPSVLPVVTPPYGVINCRVGGSGDKSGRDVDNCADGINNGLFIATQGHYANGCICNSNVTIRVHGFNTAYNEVVNIGSMHGDGELQIVFSSDTVVNGNINVWGCTKSIIINGQGGAILSSKSDTLSFNNCKHIDVRNINMVTTRTAWEKSINLYKVSDFYITNVDMSDAYVGVQTNTSHGAMYNCKGSTMDYTMVLDDGSDCYWQGTIPNGNDNLCRGASTINKLGDISYVNSSYNQPPVVSTIITRTFQGGNYLSKRSYEEDGLLAQGSWNSPYGNWHGYVTFSGISNFLSDATAINSVKVQLQRQNTSHGYSSAAGVMLNGIDRIGGLSRGEQEWFDLPQWAINDIKNGNETLNFYTTDMANYILFVNNAQIQVNVTKNIRK